MGDIILTSPVYTNLKNSFPGAEIVFLTKSKYASLFIQHPSIDRVISLGGRKTMGKIIMHIRQQQFDLMIDLHDNIRSHIIAWMGGFKKVIRYSKDSFTRRMLVWFHKKSPHLQSHTVDKYLLVLKDIGIMKPLKTLSIFSDKKIPVESINKQLNMLVIQTAFLGDSVLTIPLFEAVKKHIPCRLTVLSTPQGMDMYKTSRAVDDIITFDKKGKDKGIISLIRLIMSLRRKNFDIAIVPHRSFKSALIAFLSGISHRVGFSNSEGKMLLNHIVSFNWQDHDIERNLSLLLPFGIREKEAEWGISVGDDQKKYVQQILKNRGWDDGRLIVGINPGSVWKTKQWIKERFACVARHCAEKWHAGVILFGGMQDETVCSDMAALAGSSVLNMCGKTNLRQLSALIRACGLFITNDSGPMHIAAASGVPTLAIFGPTTRELGFSPYGKEHRVIEVDMACRPCGLHGGNKCPEKHFNCMKEITVEEVVRNVDEMLKTRSWILPHPGPLPKGEGNI